MRSKNKDWFWYSYYWRTWHRVLVRGGGEFTHQVSIQLTPLNGSDGEWADIAEINIHRRDVRYSVRNKDDRWTHELPDDVVERITGVLGKETTDLLIHADIYPMIDWGKYPVLEEKEVPFDECKFDQSWYFNYTYHDGTSNTTVLNDERRFKSMVPVEVPATAILIGGIIVVLDQYNLRLHGTYDTATGLIVIEMNYAREGQEHISRFAARMSDTWSEDFMSYIRDMQMANKISHDVYNYILQMVGQATTNLMVLRLRKTSIEG